MYVQSDGIHVHLPANEKKVKKNLINIILCGGAGTRLWPVSRKTRPKQFVPMIEGRSLFQETVRRNRNLTEDILVVSSVDTYFMAREQLQAEGGTGRYLLEPVGRNTAPALTLGSLLCDPDAIILMTTSDHLIQDTEAFEQAVEQAMEFAEQGSIVTFGIQPSYAETGFGYIEARGNDVLRFCEKPDLKTAEEYLAQGNFYWNSGMFCFKASSLLKELHQHAPEVLAHSQKAIENVDASEEIVRIAEAAMLAIPSISIDYAVMEKSSNIKVVPCSIGWSDLGSFDSIYDEFSDESKENLSINSELDPVFVASKNNLIYGSNRQIALFDTEDLIVVDSKDALLIGKRGQSQSVSAVVKELKKRGSDLVSIHQKVDRPWGSYEVLIDEETYKAKRIIVKPGQKLSLQKHRYRSEHWTIVQGKGWVTQDESCIELSKDQSAYIAAGMADVGLGIEAAASHFGLHFIPVAEEHYLFVCKKHTLKLKAIEQLLSIIKSTSFIQEINTLPGYTPDFIGEIKKTQQVFKWV